jgi:hypothetical protein
LRIVPESRGWQASPEATRAAAAGEGAQRDRFCFSNTRVRLDMKPDDARVDV